MATKTIVILLLTLFVLSACTTPKSIVRTDEYHEKKQEDTKSAKALNALQLKAIQLMNQNKFEDAIQYLQRAVKVEPRNPLNWHYLAQNYWHLNDFDRCQSMIRRAISYSQFDEDLSRANEALLNQCMNR